jgi:hypothetical protein
MSEFPTQPVKIELSGEDYERVLFAIAFASGAANLQGAQAISKIFWDLADRVKNAAYQSREG